MAYQITEIPRLYTAFAEWAACLLFILLLDMRCSRGRVAAMVIGALGLQSGFLVLTRGLPIFLWIPCMGMAFLMMALFLYATCRLRLREAFYYAMFAFALAEFAASFGWMLAWYAGETGGRISQVLLLCLVFALVYAVAGILLKKNLIRGLRMEIGGKDLTAATIITVTVFVVSNVGFISTQSMADAMVREEIARIRTLVDLGGIAMLYAHLMQLCATIARREYEAMETVLRNQYLHYKQSRESIDLIHYKYHDLKHQIAVLRREQDPEKRNQFLDKMEDEIRQYELQNKTGNKILDTVLTGKSMYCQKHGITLTCVVDGKLLDFMDIMDLCSLFGNALDNAIESQLEIEDKTKRLIHVTVTRQKQFVLIRVENYYEGKIRMREGVFLSTKGDSHTHGYGIKSIRYIAEKYGGAVTILTKDQWFDLQVLIPI